jgi:hypothetical protein
MFAIERRIFCFFHGRLAARVRVWVGGAFTLGRDERSCLRTLTSTDLR